MKYFVAAAMAVGFYACASGAVAAPRNQVGEWSQVYTIPVVPSSGALLPNGKLLLWSANQQFRFWEGQEEVHFVTIDPDTDAANYEVQQIPHNMFCTGTTQLPDGRILVNGGSFSSATSLFNPASGRWEGSGNMRIARGYNANTLLEDGSVLTIGGSWNGPIGGKIGEIWTESNGWRRMEGLKTDSMEHQDNVVWAFDSHFWLVTAGNGRVFYPGPGVNMQWLDTRGEGSVTFAGRRGSDEWAITGLAVMYDKGKILTAGGSRQYDETNTSKRAHVIDITGGAVKVQESSPMTFGRAFVNGTVLPDGKVVMVGGQSYMKGFQDSDSVMPTEIWDPSTRSFSLADSISVPRNYHSITLLLQDGRVLSGGGGLCGDCSTNHPDYQLFSPPYLFDANGNRATRPKILSAPNALEFGQTIEVTTDSDVTQFSIVRFGVATHSINNDQRRLALSFRQRGTNTYEIDLPTNPGWMLPGNWMLFAMNAAGTPSVAKIVRVKPNRTVRIVSPFEVRARQGDAIEVAVDTQKLDNGVTFSGKGLPDGLAVNPATGTISGTPTIDGVFKASIVGTGPAQTVSTDFTVYVDPANNSNQNRRPVINAPSKLDVVIGNGVDLTIDAGDPDGDALNFVAVGLPPGLTIDSATGRIIGQPQLAGYFESKVTVSDPSGATASANVDWSVTFGDLPAVSKLDVHPVPAGRAVTYAPRYVNADGLTTLWTYGDGTSDPDFSAAATRSHTFKKPGVYELSVLLKAPDGRMSVFNAVQTVYAAKHPVKTVRVSGGTAFTGSGRWLWVSNRDNNSVAAIDTKTRRLVHEIPTGRAPEGVAVSPDGQVWVVNRGSATISVVSPTKFKVVETIRLPRNSRPFDIVFRDDGRAAVTLEALRQVAILSKSGVIVDRVNLPGSARHLAFDPVRNRVIASRFVSPPAPGEGTAKINVARAKGYVYAIAPSGKLAATTALAFDRSADSEASGRGLPNYLGAPVVSPDGKTAWVPSKKDNITRGRLRDGTDLNFQNAVRAIVSKIDLASGREIAGSRIDIDNTGLARAGLFHPTGAFLFVALETSRQVAVIDPVGNTELFRFNVGRAPSALAISADGRTLYVHNMMDRTVEVVDLSPLVTRGQKAVTTSKVVKTIVKEKLSVPVLRGKQLFYDAADPRLARDGYLSCAVCHDNAEGDGRTWDFTGFGEGLRNTTSLVGRAGMKHGFLHWSANFDEVQDFEGQIRSFAGGSGLMADADFNAGTRSKPLGNRKAGLSPDLDSLAAYLSSLKTTPQSPLRTRTGVLSAKAKAGRALFTAKNCASCHAAPRYTISGDARQMRNVGTIDAAAGKRLAGPLKGIDVPTLLGTFATAPYLHDGSAPTLADAIRRHKGVKLSAREMSRIVRFLKEL